MAELRGQILIKAASAKVYAAIAIRVGFGHRWTADSKTEDKVGGECPETGRPLPGFLSSQGWTEPFSQQSSASGQGVASALSARGPATSAGRQEPC